MVYGKSTQLTLCRIASRPRGWLAGVVFLSRVPPFLKPDTLRRLLSGLGTEVLRIYLAPESAAARSGRVGAGGNKKKSYGEGWVEFEDKRRAKRIASTLNNTAMGGGNRAFYAHDLWNVKYLHKFKWHHLTEKMAYEARTKRDKMVKELTQAKKESNFYLQKVDQAKAIDAMEERKRKRAADGGDAGAGGAAASGGGKRAKSADGGAASGGGGGSDGLQEVRRNFKQRKPARDLTENRKTSDVFGSLLRTNKKKK